MQRKPKVHRQSPDLSQTKVTPRTRPVHEARHDGQLLNADPERKYVLAPKDDQHPMNHEYYISMGYRLEDCAKDGVRIVMGTTPVLGKPLEWRGHALLSCTKERAQEIFENGPTGMTGQRYYDKLMAQIKQGNLEKRSAVPGTMEEFDVGELEQNPSPQVFRE